MSLSQVSPLPHIKDVVLGDTVGQGAFACVKNAHLQMDPSIILAVKFIHVPTCKKMGLSDKDITKEVVLQSKCSKHPNVLRLIDCNVSKEYMWIILEMADGGDLFDKIEPDVGVDSDVAQFYFQQLVSAINYLHVECGVAHRDIKPENILLDKNGNLKLADFGLASQFRRKDGTLRVSMDQRGSPPYMAPEVLYSEEGYYADRTDIWSIGILLFVLLTGQTPWELPSLENEDFVFFIENDGNLNWGPWSKIEFTHLNLLRKILQPDPNKRVTLKALKLHPWVLRRASFSGDDGLCNDPELLAKKLFSHLKVSLSNENYLKFTQDTNSNNRYISTQPIGNELAELEHDSMHFQAVSNTQRAFTSYDSNTNYNSGTVMTQEAKWTQFISYDIAALQFHSDENDCNELVKRHLQFNPNKLTKFYTLQPMDVLLPILEKALNLSQIRVKPDLFANFERLCELLGYDNVFPLIINIKTKSNGGYQLCGSISIIKIEEELKSVGFERKTGDPLEWRRLFKKISTICRDIILIPN
ncbi:APG_G0004710.mRNA.1.CDS.1 [Saccharomyces cerevisiae]|uniref:non-specific serine/threonine protein kinase n=1 Tax=Saccharomyces cerevisiae (strain JAY291) TaxID=574961 RepID=C7GMV7_YEAS2|nr:Chk1p [Saccharomyces cerevisiae JAY291]CAE6453519.1 Chk1p [Saccharomyces cerevisiae PE-2]CAF1547151.1 Chk1p [Saccharomyces cerevisiae PE-2]CAI4288740.1 APG_G0004710.mRNA.1.CDS.1 [Saccharomyces cerevisiae]CAI7051031.1 APG_G0004710.mRNA.1.CDS.1 [Saccharomyces cerevisiae]